MYSTPKVSSAVLLLDLDKTCIYGNDGNDLAISLQWMERPLSEIQDLYKLLVSPCVKGQNWLTLLSHCSVFVA